ncbi:MAG: hypothetical protein UY59_C0010G0009 [Candidatus Kaiserbacteria bacterium GW2011_GWA1_50_28]|uniref:Uncharacterized protein n=1 Tax=Candidatus Kaiserbacteria bacterium GW2011_GWA1_50_28 TaxID=1618668 RepID=A0A0G1ZG72_9BACT|nr:MAG: hypothetical protein UY59_C0010G0009 [Candidatus Kaiserbacteria bacterium GW2011_GWA1_50_28]
MCPAPFAVFFELYFALDELLVLARPIIGARALLTRGQFSGLTSFKCLHEYVRPSQFDTYISYSTDQIRRCPSQASS